MSAVVHAAAQSATYACPVSPEATSWWMSLPCCIDNLDHAMTLSGALLEEDRSCQLPVLSLTLAQVIDALAQRFGGASIEGISYEPDRRVEILFDRQPPLFAPHASKLGFTDDATVGALVARASVIASGLEVCARPDGSWRF